MGRFALIDGNIKRTQRYPQYSDEEMEPWFAEIAKGYCYKQATDRVKYDLNMVENTLYSDDETMGHMLDLAMVAAAEIRLGRREVPDRWDGLFDKFK